MFVSVVVEGVLLLYQLGVGAVGETWYGLIAVNEGV
jgi:hypothetical protein